MDVDFWQYTVLIVDDNTAFRIYLRKLLESNFGVNVQESNNPKEAFAFMKTTIPSLIILDMEMPVMDGLTALKIIRDTPETKDIPVIACTVIADKELVVKLLNLKITDYILKNSEKEIIIQKLENIISNLPDRNVTFKIIP